MFTGETLRQLRSLKGFTQKELAARLHISQPAYSKLEKKAHINGEKLNLIKVIFNYTDAEIETIQKLLPH